MRSRFARWAGVAVACSALAAAPACERRDEGASAESRTVPAEPVLAEIELPDLSRLDESVRQQVREKHALVMSKRANQQTPPQELGQAYGELGMLLHAAEYYDIAEPSYRNAETLQPREMRWPYFLAHLYRREGDSAKAIAAFDRALSLNANDVPTLVWLGRMHLEQGEPDMAESLFSRAASIPPRSLAPVAGLGQAALARRDYGRAVQLLEEALQIDPRAHSLHAPLALAYRGIGDEARAETHSKQWRNTELVMVDPLVESLDVSVNSALSYELQGVGALDARDFKRAAELFQKGVDLAPVTTTLGRSLRHKLGTALALSGDVPAAVRHFEEVVRRAPPATLDEPTAKAHYSLGVLNAGVGRMDIAIRHLGSAVQYNPNYVEARMALGDALRSAGQVEASLQHYGEAVRLSPSATQARFGYAMGLVRLGRYVEARDWLGEGVRIQPDRPELTLALARILAAAPDARARDGQRALMMARDLFAVHRRVDVGETMAMALAEVGQFPEAITLQREIIELARQAGGQREVRHMTANLRLYEQRQPCRTPWPADDPVHSPGPQGAPPS
jgi:tetratricopeptide (TPR) repeat protein